jgi:hypothetical protein
MADAWGTPGWTATNGIPLTSDIPPALVPADVLMVNITAQFGAIDGKHQTGFLLVEANTDLVHVPSGGVSHKPAWLGRLIDGAVALKVPATDNTTLARADGDSSSDWYYKVSVIIYGQVVDVFYAFVPYSATNVPFTTLVRLNLLPDGSTVPWILDGGTA